MADSVTSNVVFAGDKVYAIRLTNVSDGTGEADVTKVDISTLTKSTGVAPTKISIQEIQWTVQGFTSVTLEWDHTADTLIDVLTGNGYRDYSQVGLLTDSGTGGTGDILLSTTGAVSGASYDILLVCVIS